MSLQTELAVLMNTLVENGTDQQKVTELQQSFDDQQVEVFLEKLAGFEDLDTLINDSPEHSDQSNQFIDFVSDLIIHS